ncbi:MAG: hypothetical protein NT157_01225, partial [Candidatus Micrarchaeota archaeon]|nr:hypothetical protein [Candidatus Micrarchaeota archaeon]
PDDYKFSFSPSRPAENHAAVEEFANSLKDEMSPIDVHNLAFQVAKSRNAEPASLFKSLYQAIISKDRGPKLGKLVCAIGVAKVKEALLSKTR